MIDGCAPDSELEAVFAQLIGLDPDGSRMAATLRRSIDMLLDGPNSGRYDWEQLHKTEKTHGGTLVEINFQREFKFEDGEKLDYRIAGVDVDCKFSQKIHGWMIPLEAVDKLLLVVWAWDPTSRWSAGVVRAKAEYLPETGGNRDKKRYLNEAGKQAVRWLFHDKPLPENALLHMAPDDVAAIYAKRSGQQRLNELARRAQGKLLTRNVVATVATANDPKPYKDPLKRLRNNGGARTQLRAEGIIVLGQFKNHCDIARQLELPVPGPSEFVSIRLAPRGPQHYGAPFVEIGGQEWVAASKDDPVVEAPMLPNVGSIRE
ncbi:NaeI family type II restriction endonuclease [Nonomuraea sp. NPDC050556]|uniref:NaeI family type II restriction endonuclease n=1 Tax=Nonomuraea sp. NPDC050556 TaxID=3364369 RepID=UPI003794EE04